MGAGEISIKCLLKSESGRYLLGFPYCTQQHMHIFGGRVVKDFRRRSHEPRAEAQALYRLVAFVASAVMIALAELQVVGASMV